MEKPIAHLACDVDADILNSYPLTLPFLVLSMSRTFIILILVEGTHQAPLVVTSDTSRKREPCVTMARGENAIPLTARLSVRQISRPRQRDEKAKVRGRLNCQRGRGCS